MKKDEKPTADETTSKGGVPEGDEKQETESDDGKCRLDPDGDGGFSLKHELPEGAEAHEAPEPEIVIPAEETSVEAVVDMETGKMRPLEEEGGMMKLEHPTVSSLAAQVREDFEKDPQVCSLCGEPAKLDSLGYPKCTDVECPMGDIIKINLRAWQALGKKVARLERRIADTSTVLKQNKATIDGLSVALDATGDRQRIAGHLVDVARALGDESPEDTDFSGLADRVTVQQQRLSDAGCKQTEDALREAGAAVIDALFLRGHPLDEAWNQLCMLTGRFCEPFISGPPQREADSHLSVFNDTITILGKDPEKTRVKHLFWLVRDVLIDRDRHEAESDSHLSILMDIAKALGDYPGSAVVSELPGRVRERIKKLSDLRDGLIGYHAGQEEHWKGQTSEALAMIKKLEAERGQAESQGCSICCERYLKSVDLEATDGKRRPSVAERLIDYALKKILGGNG